MSCRFLCSGPNAPPGFTAWQPVKSELLHGTVVLLADSDGQGEELLAGLWDRFCGVLLIAGEPFGWQQRGPRAWKLCLPADQIPVARTFLTTWTPGSRTVSERQRVREAETALSRSEQDLTSILDSIGDAVVASDARGNIRRMNPAAETLSAWQGAAAIGRPLLEVFPLRSLPARLRLDDVVHQIVERVDKDHAQRNHLLLARDDHEFRLAPSASPILDEQGQCCGYVFVFRDKTAQYRLEEELRQRQSLDALGQLAGGVAHEFNNMLAGINGFAELLEMKLSRDQSSQSMLKSIKTTVERAAGLTRQLLSFARRHASQKKVLDLHKLIVDVLDLAAHTFDRRIVIDTRLEAPSVHILGEPSLLQTVLLNLFVNARDAMPDGGRLTVQTSVIPADLAESLCQRQQDMLVLAVTDTGVGIPEDQLERIFEPFFTTKDPGQGSGLGLSALYGIMQEHQGQVRVVSQVGLGSTFTLFFPLSAQKPPQRQAESEKNHRPGRVLVVEDEEFIRQFLKNGLERHGYTVTLLDNGLEGVKAVKTDPDAFDIVVMDINMPFMNGRDALAAMRPEAPLLPVILISGYITEDDLEDLRRKGAAAVLPKPFRIRDLLQQIAENIRRQG